jgi:hypothetical protein
MPSWWQRIRVLMSLLISGNAAKQNPIVLHTRVWEASKNTFARLAQHWCYFDGKKHLPLDREHVLSTWPCAPFKLREALFKCPLWPLNV